ncbi:hypothetical protein PUNSTDRAFT_137936 [Punctularia strigosozonata HHB-11173 SS5]|uniref:Retrotransposon gag domain-containing protein n=1 Tax=Punctularia strigosozonata (strain HHB-11173) TaxID=741275 RepID=R7S5K9_PUNST|nr:uncharacterized protein PUNSTDRAFT_137936 [Punctularia strigosozonata HHB-11173 SS5]EIN05252.1 hypothetical protein PUNSTDRAFT_137936 [Punctularia strigosozonata HHB-11173 SS5]
MDEDLPPVVPPALQNQPVQAEEAPPEPPTVLDLLTCIVAMEGYLHQERVRATIKFCHPDSFDGTRSMAWTFLQSVNDYLNHSHCVDPIQRIQFLLSYCHGGMAGTWADNISKIRRNLQMGVREPKEAPAYLASWVHIERHFRMAFEDSNPTATAFNKLRTLHMGSSIAEDFICQFKNLAEEAGDDRDVSLLTTFMQAIPSHFRISLESMPLRPDTLPEWKAGVTRMDRRLREASAARQAEASRLHSFQSRPPSRLPLRALHLLQDLHPCRQVFLWTSMPHVEEDSESAISAASLDTWLTSARNMLRSVPLEPLGEQEAEDQEEDFV